tara:strand:- start:785 stop:1039 length:255 start_codon:yes stop_codon:yes gene_type:complete
MMSEKYYIYEVSESSVDVKSWTIESDRQLTEEEVSDIYQDSQVEDEGKQYQYSDGIMVTYDGTEWGYDAQPLLDGDFKEEEDNE